MYKLILMPTLSPLQKSWAEKLDVELAEFNVIVANDDHEAKAQISDADAAFGFVPNKLLAKAKQLRWIQAHHAAPPPGFYYHQLTESSVTVTNFRGVYNDHISAHIMMYVLGLSRGITGYLKAQSERSYDVDANDKPFVYLPDATAIIFGVGGIGCETAKHCKNFGMHIIGIDPRVLMAPDSVDELVTPGEYEKVIGKGDFIIVTMPHTQTIGRLGDIANGEHCAKAASHFLSFTWSHPQTLASNCAAGFVTGAEPVILYEMVGNCIILAIIWSLRDRLKPAGMLWAVYLSLYSLARFGISFAREDRIWAWGMQEAHYIALLVLIITIPLLVYKARWVPREAIPQNIPVVSMLRSNTKSTRAQRRRKSD